MTTIPTTPEQADAWFRCDRLRGSMSGSACAARWSQATVARRYGHGSMGIEGYDCKGCQLGAARHRLGAHERPPQFQMIEPPRAPAASKDDQEDEMPKRHDLTPTARAVLAWATGRDWWRRRDVDEGVESGDHAVACALRDLRGLGLLEMRGKTTRVRYRITATGIQRATALGLALPASLTASSPAPPMPIDPDPPAAPPPVAEVVELQPEVSTEAVPDPPSVTLAHVELNRAAERYVAARDALRVGAELAAHLLDEVVEVEVIAFANGLRKLATALEVSFTALDEARFAVAAEQYDAVLAQMGVAA